MQKCILIAFGLLTIGQTFAQQATSPKSGKPAQAASANLHKSCVGGMFTDNHYHPIEGIQAFIYARDSSIIASGYSDAYGAYETNSVMPGTYTVKIVYPNSKALIVPGVIIKAGVTNISLKSDKPSADTTIPFALFQPKPVEKPKAKKK